MQFRLPTHFNNIAWAGDPLQHNVYLTFDDGPNPEVTPGILDILDRFKARAVFFLLGQKVEQHPNLVEDIYLRNHVIGNHGYSHTNLLFAARKKIAEEISATDKAIYEITKKPPELFRPAYGRFRPGLIRILAKEGKKIMLWNFDSHDYKHQMTSQQIVDRCCRKIKPGAIILFHDGHQNSSKTLKALTPILQHIRNKNLKPRVLTW